MAAITLPADVVSGIHYLRKHLYNPQPNRKLPRVTPMGDEITDVKQIASLECLDNSIAAVFVLSDPTCNPLLMESARKVLSDETKRLRIVRTGSGVRRFRQSAGSIIVDDNETPLDNLQALSNDIEGYEKLAGADGETYYIGLENGKWVIRNPKLPDAVHTASSQESAFSWLNTSVSSKKKPTDKKPREPGDRETINEPSDPYAIVDMAPKLANLRDDQLDIYALLTRRGITPERAYAIVYDLPGPKK